jgi:two-component system, NtrC family, sensor kinase
MHSLLKEQIEKYWGDAGLVPAELMQFLGEVDQTYAALDQRQTVVTQVTPANFQIPDDLAERELLELELRSRNMELEQALSQLKKVQNSMVLTEKMASLGQLTAGIAHEINNPLAFVCSNLNRFRDYFQDVFQLLHDWQEFRGSLDQHTAASEALKKIQEREEEIDLAFIQNDFDSLMRHTLEGTNRIRNIVEQLRGFTHLSGTGSSEANIIDAIDDTLTMVWNELKYKASVIKDYQPIPLVSCNIGEIKQVLVNLLVNAAHAIDKSGEIVIRTSRVNDRHIAIEISDTGSGISPDILGKIFDPFFTTKAVGKGTGLGLWISTTIIQKHGGTISVRSAKGRGTTFTITLPVNAGGSDDPND